MIHIFIGTKAQLIKMAPIMRELQDREIDYRFIFSGQHRNTIDDLRANFGIKKPDVCLYEGMDITSIMKMAFWLLLLLYQAIIKRDYVWGNKRSKKDIVVVHGDTFSTLAGILMGKLAGIRIAHVESGLRSFNFFHPFPEEITRILCFWMSDLFFAPGDWAANNLKKYSKKIVNTKNNSLLDALNAQYDSRSRIDIPEDHYGMVSLHRFENLISKRKLLKIIHILEAVSKRKKLLFILHDPTLKKLELYGLKKRLERNNKIDLHPRYDYFDFITLVKASDFVITDGGSNQEECFYLGKPCLLMRKLTERQEGKGKNMIISHYDIDKVLEFVSNYSNYQFDSQSFFNEKISPAKIVVSELILAQQEIKL